MDPESARSQLFQLTSLSVFCTQLSYHLEEDTISTCIMTLGDFNLVLFWGFFSIGFHHHSAFAGPPRDTQ